MKRVLVVTYYFPPSGGSGVQRVLKFVKYLRDFGYEPEVLTVAEGAYPQRDPSLAADVPEGVVVHRTASWDPFGAYARLSGKKKEEAVTVGRVGEGGGIEPLARWLRANVFLPDARVGWVPYAVREALRLHRRRPFDVVLTSGPPHSAHLIGRALRRRAGIGWVADFRDPWTEITYNRELPMSGAARALDRRLERSVLREASEVVTVSPALAADLGARAGGSRSVAVVYNGYDEADFEGLRRGPEAVARDAFVLAHVGSLFADPAPVLTALARLHAEGALERLRLCFVGSVHEERREAMAAYGLGEVTEFVPYVPHREAVRAMAEAALLLLVIDPAPASAGVVTGKLYEYLGSGRPVLGVGPAGGDAARLLEETGGGALFAPEQQAEIAAFLRSQYAAWEAGAPAVGAGAEALQPLTRRAQTSRLAVVLDAAAGQGGR